MITVLYNKNNRITKSVLSKMADIDRRYFDDNIKCLQELGVVSVEINSSNHLQIELLKTNEHCIDILEEDVSYKKIRSIAKDKIREKVTKIVKKECA